MKKRVLLALPLVYMGVIFVFSSIPVDLEAAEQQQGLFSVPEVLQNLLHIPAFALLCFLWIMALRARGRALRDAVLLALIFTIGYGWLDEWHQSFVPGRFMGIMDVGRDTLGALVGAGAFWILVGLRRRIWADSSKETF